MGRESYAICPTCDLVVFEDDIVFVPGFREKWTKFLEALPPDWDYIKLGAGGLWVPSFEATPNYIHVRAPAENFGYVVRARALKGLADHIATIPVRGAWGLDATLQLFTSDFKFFVPKMPLVMSASGCHDTAESRLRKEDCETVKTLQSGFLNLMRNWPSGYTRTYCNSSDPEMIVPDKDAKKKYGTSSCSIIEAEVCCPYKIPE